MSIYDLMNYIGALSILLFNILNVKEYQTLSGGRLRSLAEKRRTSGHTGVLSSDSFWVVIESILLSVFQYALAPMLNKVFGDVTGTGSNYFGLLFIGPIILYIGCRIMQFDFPTYMDAVTPAFPLALFFAKIGCYSAGCCRGITWHLDIMNPYTKIKEFPIQLLEAGVALTLFVFLFLGKKLLKTGTVFPVYLILYSGIRFFTEFLRYDEPILWLFKTYHFLCILGVLAGIAEYRLIHKSENIPSIAD